MKKNLLELFNNYRYYYQVGKLEAALLDLGCPEDEDAVFTCKLSEEDGVWIDSEDTVHDILTYGVRVAPAKTEDLNTGRYFYDLEIDVNNDVFTLMKGRLLLEYDVTR